MGLLEMQEAVKRHGDLMEDWLRPSQRNQAGICEALCLDWLSKALPLLGRNEAPSELTQVALDQFQRDLENKPSRAGERANQKAAARGRALADDRSRMVQVAARALCALEAHYSKFEVETQRVRSGIFETISHCFQGGSQARIDGVVEGDRLRARYDAMIQNLTVQLQDQIDKVDEPVAKFNDLSSAQKARKGYKPVLAQMAAQHPRFGNLKAVASVSGSYASGDPFAQDLGARDFPTGTAWLVALATPGIRHAMVCCRKADADYWLLEPNLGLYKMHRAGAWTDAVSTLVQGYDCNRHDHRAVSFNRVAP